MARAGHAPSPHCRNTVKKHVSTMMGKLNTRNRTQAVLLARRLGLLE
jgi:DNA-binding NarL/FixJ family response regulator